MTQSATDYFSARVEAVRASERQNASERSGWPGEDRRDLVLEAADYLRTTADVPRLEKQLLASSRLDHATLNEMIQLFVDAAASTPQPFALTLPNGTVFDPGESIRALVTLRDGLASPEQLEGSEVGLRLGFVGDMTMSRLLTTLVTAQRLRDDLPGARRQRRAPCARSKTSEMPARA